MTPRVAKLRQESFEAKPSISVERAVLVTRFYRQNYGKYSIPVLRALNFQNLCQKKTLYIGPDELIVGERGPFPKAVSTFPELTCHSVDDLKILNSREMTRYLVADEDIETYQKEGSWFGKVIASDNPKAKIGTDILRGFTQKNGEWKGKIFAAKRGKIMDAVIQPAKDLLNITVSAGFISKTLEWKRAEE